MAVKHYALAVWAGVQLDALGPYDGPGERDARAKEAWTDCEPEQGGNVFWANVMDDGTLETGPYPFEPGDEFE